MRIDLERTLESIATRAAGDASPVPVDRVLGRLHRRRAARTAAASGLAVAAVAAVAVAAIALPRTAPIPPATPDPSPTTTTGFGECGSTITAPSAEDTPEFWLDADVRQVDVGGDDPQASVDVSFTESPGSLGTREQAHLVLTRDGVVVAPPAELNRTWESYPPSYGFHQPLVSCEDGTPLPGGSYQIYALQEFSTDDEPGRAEVLGGPWTLAVIEPGPTATTAEEALADTLARAPVHETFPVCGSAVPTQVDPPLTIDLVLPERAYAPGEAFSTDVTLRATDRTVLADTPVPLGGVVIARDGIVVASGLQEPVGNDAITVVPDEPLTISASAELSLCEMGDVDYPPYYPSFPLPPGTYQAYATAGMWLTEIRTSEGAHQVDALFYAMSDPVDITID